MLAVHYVSYYNTHEYVKNSEEMRRAFLKLRDVDKLWQYLVYAFELARSEVTQVGELDRDQLEIFLVTDKIEWKSNMLLFKTKKRLRAIRQRTEAQLAKLKKIGNVSLFHRHHQHRGAHRNGGGSEVEKGKGIGPVSAGSIRIKERDSRERLQKNDDESKMYIVDMKLKEEKAKNYVKKFNDIRFLEIIANGVLGRKALIEEIVSIQGTQSELNCRLSASNIRRLKWNHEDRSAANAANAMNVLHRGWTQVPIIDPKTGGENPTKRESKYLYFNRQLAAMSDGSLATESPA